MSNARAAEKVDLSTKLFYGAGAVAYGVKDNGFRYLLLLFYNQVVGLPAALVALAIMAALVVDSVLDPIIGQASDMWRSKWGRRHPFMYAAALPAAASFWMLWHPPAGWPQEALIVYLAVLAVIVRSFIALYEVPSAALISELTSDYDKRTAILAYRHFFGWWGGLILYAVTLVFFFQPTENYPVGQLNPEGYEKYALLAAAMMFGSILISALGTHRQIPHLHIPPERKRTWLGVLKEMFASFANRSFLMVMGGGVFGGIAIGISAAMYIYWATYFWELSAQEISILLIDNFISSSLALVVTPHIAKRFGKRAAKIGLLILAVTIGVAPLLLRTQGWFFANESPWLLPALFVHGAIYATFATGSLILDSAMIADVVEDSQTRTGRRSEGLFFAGALLVQKAISGVGIFATGMILSFVHFPQGARPGAVDADVLRNLVFAVVAALFILYAISIVFIAQYRIDRKRHEENLRKLAEAGTAGVSLVPSFRTREARSGTQEPKGATLAPGFRIGPSGRPE